MIVAMSVERTEEDFRKIFRAYYPLLRAYAVTFIGESEADDVVQEVFSNLWKHRSTIVFGDHIESYLFRATYTRCMNLLKHRQVATRRLQLLDDINEYREQYFDNRKEEPLYQLERKELRQHITRAIASLPDKCRQVFRLSYLQDMSNKEIATALDISVRTVETHIYKALKQLRTILK